MSKEKEWFPNVILCGPGGSRGILLLGALKRFFEEKIGDKNFLGQVKIWAGVSIGAAISLLIVSGYTVEEIIDISLGVSLIEDIMNINLNDITRNLGLMKLQSIEEKLKHFIHLKFGKIPTLQELYEITNLELSVVTFNCNKMRSEFLDRHTTPELSCVEAAILSMTIPILFQPRKLKSDLCIDGAIGSPFPVTHYDVNDRKVIGMYISSEDDYLNLDKNPLNFLYRLIHASMKVLRDTEIKYSSPNVKTLKLTTDFKDTTGLTMGKEAREEMLNKGYDIADSFLKLLLESDKYVFIPESEEIPF